MKALILTFGLLLAVGALVWFFYFVPLGCSMNTTGCKEQFTVWSRIGLIHLWLPLVLAAGAITYGLTRS